MDIILDFVILFSDKIVDIINSFRSFSRLVEQAKPGTEITTAWLYNKLGEQLCFLTRSSKKTIHRLLVSVSVNKRSKYKILVRALDVKGKRVFELVDSYDANDVPDEFRDISVNKIRYYSISCTELSGQEEQVTE